MEHIDDEALQQKHRPLSVEMNLTCPQWSSHTFLLTAHGSTVSFRENSGKVVAKIILANYDESGTSTVAVQSAIRQENGRFDFAGYDAAWFRLKIEENKTLFALTRLRYPYELSGEMREQYTGHLKKAALIVGTRLVEEEQAEDLAWMLEEGYFSETDLPKLVDHSSALGKTAITALLLAGSQKLTHSAGNFPAFHL